MDLPPRWIKLLVVALILVGGLLPPTLYWLVLGQLPTLTPAEAIQRLNAPGSTAVLVDVRAPADFGRLRVDGARSLPWQQIQGWSGADQIPANLRGKTLLLVCDNGWLTARAVYHLRAIGQPAVFNVRGGMQEWAKAAWRVPKLSYTTFTGPGQAPFIPLQRMPVYEQLAQVAAGFVVKPLYMLGNLLLAIFLLRETAHDMVALRWGLFAFFLGELFCYVNLLLLGDDSYLAEYLHSFGMVVGFGFIFYAVIEGLEMRLLHANDINKRCGLIGVCLLCSHYRAMTCRVQRAAQVLIPVGALLATIPLMARIDTTGYNSLIGDFQWYFARFGVYQLYEDRLLPVLILACFAIAYLPLWLKQARPIPRLTQIFTAAGLGALSFSLIRLSLGSMYATTLVWFNFWEELTELVFILAIAAGLWLFRVHLFPKGFGRWVVEIFH